MLDHVFTDAIGAMREVFEAAHLERQAFEEHFQSDVLLGDLTFETSYGLPGEGSPPRVRADVTLEWPTWSQTAYRLWYIGEEFDDPPRIDVELVFRLQRLAEAPDPRVVLDVLPRVSPDIGTGPLDRAGPTVETVHDADLTEVEYALEVSYEGSYELTEEALGDGTAIDRDFAAMGGWIASMLVKLGDLRLASLPPLED
jgi:hypothetical protein